MKRKSPVFPAVTSLDAPANEARARIPARGRHAVGLIRLGQTRLGAATQTRPFAGPSTRPRPSDAVDPKRLPAANTAPTTTPPRAAAQGRGVARIGLKRIAVPRRGTAVAATPSSPTRREHAERGSAGKAEPCDLALWSRGLYGVFLPDRRGAQRPIAFADRRC